MSATRCWIGYGTGHLDVPVGRVDRLELVHERTRPPPGAGLRGQGLGRRDRDGCGAGRAGERRVAAVARECRQRPVHERLAPDQQQHHPQARGRSSQEHRRAHDTEGQDEEQGRHARQQAGGLHVREGPCGHREAAQQRGAGPPQRGAGRLVHADHDDRRPRRPFRRPTPGGREPGRRAGSSNGHPGHRARARAPALHTPFMWAADSPGGRRAPSEGAPISMPASSPAVHPAPASPSISQKGRDHGWLWRGVAARGASSRR